MMTSVTTLLMAIAGIGFMLGLGLLIAALTGKPKVRDTDPADTSNNRAIMPCPRCGARDDRHARFCKACGTALVGSAVAPSSASHNERS